MFPATSARRALLVMYTVSRLVRDIRVSFAASSPRALLLSLYAGPRPVSALGADPLGPRQKESRPFLTRRPSYKFGPHSLLFFFGWCVSSRGRPRWVAVPGRLPRVADRAVLLRLGPSLGPSKFGFDLTRTVANPLVCVFFCARFRNICIYVYKFLSQQSDSILVTSDSPSVCTLRTPAETSQIPRPLAPCVLYQKMQIQCSHPSKTNDCLAFSKAN